ncbi:hypothetical protein [Pseudonocardia acidicola]|uniref:Uncharacterized protein n=1 Tax=Pseudonocardia acidicola TaxID=2724939 RepID=A0ABX1SKD1_9PSEU|nr:hypothetical protein [Pseudonocardia acidicola]NMI00730.1 hypothetical protein [Pseudonocardia acidicola]
MDQALALWEFALWGAFGGVAVEILQVIGAIKRTKNLPWLEYGEVSLPALLVSAVLRLGLGAGLAVALGQAGQIAGSVGAVAVGIAAPLIVEQMGKQVPHGQPYDYAQAPERGNPLPPPSSGGRRIGGAGGGSDPGQPREVDGRWTPRRRAVGKEVLLGLFRSTPAFGGTTEYWP